MGEPDYSIEHRGKESKRDSHSLDRHKQILDSWDIFLKRQRLLRIVEIREIEIRVDGRRAGAEATGNLDFISGQV